MPAALQRHELHEPSTAGESSFDSRDGRDAGVRQPPPPHRHRRSARRNLNAPAPQPARKRVPAARRQAARGTANPAALHATHPARDFYIEKREEAHPAIATPARRRSYSAHRDFRISWTACLCSAAIFGQLLWMIYVKGMASSASLQSSKLDLRIAQTEDDVERARRKIAAMTSVSQVSAWAKQLNLRPATQADIDPVGADDTTSNNPGLENSGDADQAGGTDSALRTPAARRAPAPPSLSATDAGGEDSASRAPTNSVSPAGALQ